MTDKVHPSFNREAARSRETSAAIAYGGGAGEGFVWPNDDRLVEDSEGDLATGPLDSFDATTSAASLDVTIQTGEALRRGAYLARDTTTTITLPASSTTTIALGWKDGAADTVLLGEPGTAVGDTFDPDDPRAPIWTFTTDTGGVTATTDERTVTTSPTSANFASWTWRDVSQNGLAPNGTTDAGQFIEDNAADNTVLIFPPGTYTFDTTANVDGLDNFGLWSPGGGAVFTPGALGDGDTMLALGTTTPVDNVFVEGMDTDTASAQFADYAGDIRFEDIEFTAERTTAQAQYAMSGLAPGDDDTVLMRNVRMPNGGAFNTTAGDSPGGFYVRPPHAGTLRFEECELGGFANNGLYGSGPGESGGNDGRVVVDGGTYRNSNVACVRIGGDNSVVRDVDIVLDTVKSGFTSLRGVYVRNGDSLRVESVRVELAAGLAGHDGIDVVGGAGSCHVEDCRVTDDGSNRPVSVSAEDTARTDPVTFENLTVAGSADGTTVEYAVEAARNHTRFENLSLSQPNRSGVEALGEGVTVEDSVVDAANVPVRLAGVEGTVRATETTQVNVDGTDCTVDDRATNTELTVNTTAGADRLVRNGWGQNAGDPAVEGPWNGHGYEGAQVLDLSGDFIGYIYRNGSWHTFSDLLDTSFAPTWNGQHTFAANSKHETDVWQLMGSDDEWGVRHVSTGTNEGAYQIVRDPLTSGRETVASFRRQGNPHQFFGERFSFNNQHGTGDQSTIVDVVAGADGGGALYRVYGRDTNENQVLIGSLGYSDANDWFRIRNQDTPLVQFDKTGASLRFPTGGDGAVNDEVVSGVATLSGGAATVSTGVTTTGTNLNVFLDPSGNGANASDVKAAARVFWDSSAAEYKIEILEDGTSVGNPDVGYKVVRGDSV